MCSGPAVLYSVIYLWFRDILSMAHNPCPPYHMSTLVGLDGPFEENEDAGGEDSLDI